MPSSLTGVLSRALGSSPRPPVSVSGTGTSLLARGFSWQPGLGPFGTRLPSPSRLGLACGGFAYRTPYSLGPGLPSPGGTYPSASPHRSSRRGGGTGISTRFPSPTPFGLGLGPDSPWVDEPSPGTLGLSADRILTCLFATYAGILSSVRSTPASAEASTPNGTLPYQPARAGSEASVAGLAPLHFRRRNARPVSYYALFE